jgi:putative transposase
MMLAAWRDDYNVRRPHSGLGWRTPAEYAATFEPQRAPALRSIAGSAPAPVAQPAQMSVTNRPSYLPVG